MTSTTAPKSTSSVKREHSAEEIVEKITLAILEHRLAPGTKLGEDRLANIFGANRPKIREVLARLAHEQVVELIPQRGAFVSKPSIEQAYDVFEARRLIEPGILHRLVEHINADKLNSLQKHLLAESDARKRQDARAIVRLSGEFHVLLAELSGNTALVKVMRELSALTCLIISLYDAPTATSCRADEHAEIVAAISRGDIERAIGLMQHHLEHIEKSLNLDKAEEVSDLESIFA